MRKLELCIEDEDRWGETAVSNSSGPYFFWTIGASYATLDGMYTVDQLMTIVALMTAEERS